MKKKFIVFFIVFIIMIFSYRNKAINIDVNSVNEINNHEKVSDSDKDDIHEETINVNALINNDIVSLSLEDYVIGVVACEMPASFDSEALKAMSVAARTYALYKKERNNTLKTTTDDQCYIMQLILLKMNI